MDYFLPLLNGLETTKQLRQKNIEIPVIFLTVNKDVALAVEVMKAGVEVPSVIYGPNNGSYADKYSLRRITGISPTWILPVRISKLILKG